MTGTVYLSAKNPGTGLMESTHSSGHAIAVNPGGGAGIPQVPSIAGTPKALVGLDAGAALLMGFKITPYTEGDDIAASERLARGFPYVAHSPIDGSIVVTVSKAISQGAVVGVKVGGATGNCIARTGTDGTTDTAANALAQMTIFDFDAPVEKFIVTGIADPTGRYCEISVEPYTYA
jgi:hypothetical protein